MSHWTALLAAIGLFLAGDAASGGAAMADRPLHAMTFNIRFGTADDGANHWNHRKELVLKVLTDHRADFAGLQEAMTFQTSWLAERLPGYAHLGRTRGRIEGESEGCPIFYIKEYWEPTASGTFWFSDTPEEPGTTGWGNTIPRITTWARFIEKKTGRGVYVFNTHLDHQSQPSRERSAKLLVQRIAAREHRGEPVIVLGDFNAGETNPAMMTMKEAGLVDTFRVLHPEAQPAGTFGNFVGNRTGEKIDYVLTTQPVRATSAAIVYDNARGRYPSDHYPVVAGIEFQRVESNASSPD